MDLRYVTERRNKDGTVRRYWQRPGQKVHRLPDDATWASVADSLNRRADAGDDDARPEGSIGWVVRRYIVHRKFRKLAPSTRKIYERWLADLECRCGHLPPSAMTRRVCVEFVERAGSLHSQKHAAAVLFNLLDLARYYGLVQINEASALGLETPKPRQTIWTDEEFDRFIDGCRGGMHGEGLIVGHYLLLYTGQRPGDVLRMRRPDYSGRTIKLVQQKTDRKLEVHCHRRLRGVLDAHLKRSNSIFLASRDDGQPFPYERFRALAKLVRQATGLAHLQNRDLRRTAVVKLAEAGATTSEIIAVTGHSRANANQILEVYGVRTLEASRHGIEKWEEKDGA